MKSTLMDELMDNLIGQLRDKIPECIECEKNLIAEGGGLTVIGTIHEKWSKIELRCHDCQKPYMDSNKKTVKKVKSVIVKNDEQ